MLGKLFGDITKRVNSLVGKYKNQSFMEACVYTAAGIGFSNGHMSTEEKQKLMGYCSQSEALQVFDQKDINAVFTKAAESYGFDYQVGWKNVQRKLKELTADMPQDEKEDIIILACLIGSADGDFDDTEKKLAKEICTCIGVSPDLVK